MRMCVALIAACIGSAATAAGQGADGDMPVIDVEVGKARTASAVPDRRGDYFDGHGETLESTVPSGGRSRVKHVDYIAGFPLALPFAKSDAVVRGKVTRAQAKLSEDGSNIYSEFTVEVGSSFKLDGAAPGPGSTVTVLREGGIARFGTVVIKVRQTDWGFPVAGGDYLFFLDGDPRLDGAYLIVTAYRLDDGTVSALDDNPQAAAWKGRPAAELVAAVAKESRTSAPTP